jgi:hypothetical protein
MACWSLRRSRLVLAIPVQISLSAKGIAMIGITTSVAYDDFLAITLPRNVKHFKQIIVVTTPTDRRTQRVVSNTPKAICFLTREFHRDGARLNKGAAIEAALQRADRGWVALFDADVILPDGDLWKDLQGGCIYGAHRHMLYDVSRFHDKLDWSDIPIRLRDVCCNGYLQVFHTADPALGTPPWYPIHRKTADHVDWDFFRKWPEEKRIWLPWNVLHLGENGRNWNGRVTKRIHV